MTSLCITTGSGPLFGWHHAAHVSGPAVGARGTVVICPPLFDEQIVGYQCVRLLATRLAEAGFGVIRFDYLGTGESAGDLSINNLVDEWRTNIAAAVAYARDLANGPVIAVGLRMGATLLSEQLPTLGELGALVLWDPFANGATFVRREQALQLMTTQDESISPVGVDVPGFLLPQPLVRDLRQVQLGTQFGDALPTLVLVDPEPTPAIELAALVARDHIDTLPANTLRLFSVDDRQAVTPRHTVDLITHWLAKHFDASPGNSATPSDAGPTDVRVHDSGSKQIVERQVWLGPARLASVRCGRADLAHAPGTPTVGFLTTATSYRIGQSRLHVDVARAIALSGITSYRIDSDDTGDSPHALDEDAPTYYRPEAVDTLAPAVEEIRSSEAGPVALVGLRSGAWLAVRTALRTHVDSLYLVNPSGWDAHPKPRGPHVGPQMSFLRKLAERMDRLQFLQGVANAMWHALAALHIVSSPSHTLEQLIDSGTTVTIFAGVDELRWLRRGSSQATLDRLTREGKLRIQTSLSDDHGLTTWAEREHVSNELVSYIQADLGRTERVARAAN